MPFEAVRALVQDVDTDFEVGNRGPSGTGTDLPGLEVVVAAGAKGSAGVQNDVGSVIVVDWR